MSETEGFVPEEYTETAESPDSKVKPKHVSRRGFLSSVGKAAMGMTAAAAMSETLYGSAVKEQESKEDAILREDWERCKSEIAKLSIREDIKFIENVFGKSGQSITFKAKEDLTLIDQLMETEKSGTDLIRTKAQKDLLEAALGEYKLFWRVEHFSKIAKESYKASPQPQIKGFEKTKWGNDGVRKLLDNFDTRWVGGNVSSVEYIDEVESLKTFDVAGYAFNEGLPGMFYKSGEEKVVIHKSSDIESKDNFNELLAHEIAHHNDWANTNALTLPERLRFLREIGERLLAEDHCYSHYVDVQIPEEYKDQGPEFVKYRQAKEYWAMLNGSYDSRKDLLLKNQPKDHALVQDWRDKIIQRYS
jgi:hypothetical protein